MLMEDPAVREYGDKVSLVVLSDMNVCVGQTESKTL